MTGKDVPIKVILFDVRSDALGSRNEVNPAKANSLGRWEGILSFYGSLLINLGLGRGILTFIT